MRKLTKAIIAVLCIVICMSVFFACDNDGFHQYTELKSDGEYHWYECPDDGAIKPDSKEAHKDENSDGKCDVCDYAMEIPHTHNYSELKSSSEYHWYECACGDQKPDSKVKHVDENRDGECDICHKAVTVIDIKGVRFAIAGKDGKEDVSLNGVEVTIVDISDKNNSFKATIADGQFVSTEIIPLGEYTVSAEGYNSTTINITKDGIDCAVVVLNKIHTVANSVKIEEKDGVPTLIVEGMIPEIEGVTIGNVMLHYDAEYTAEGEDAKTKHHFYVANTSDYAGVYHFELALSELPASSAQTWSWFHIYPYAAENPTKDSTPLTTEGCDLPRGEVLKIFDSYTYNKVKYQVRAWGDENPGKEGTGLAISTDKIPDTTITVKGIKLDETKGALVLSGEYTGEPAAIAIHTNTSAQGSEDRHYYGNVLSPKDGKFEVEINLTQITYADTPWCWFHLYIYNEQVPESDKLANYDSKVDLKLNGLIETEKYIDYDGVRYTIKANDYDSLVIAPTVAPTINNVTSVEIKQIEEKPVLVVKGTTSKDVPCIKIHVDGDDNNYYSSANVEAKQGKEFEVQIGLSQLATAGKTYWFHLYCYDEAEPDVKNAKFEKLDIPRDKFETVQAGKTFDYNDLRYTCKDTWSLVEIAVTNVPKTAVTSIALEAIEGVPTLVVKGTVADDVAIIKLHANDNSEPDNLHFYAEGTISEGQFEIKFDLTKISAKDKNYWFHVYTYKSEEAEPASSNLPYEPYVKAYAYFNVGEARYTVKENSWNGLQIEVTAIPSFDVTSIAVEGKKLIVKGNLNDDSIKCIKLHADGNDGNYYSSNVSEEAGKFEFQFDLTQLSALDKDYYFHVYGWKTEDPGDAKYDSMINVPRKPFVNAGDAIKAGDLYYTICDNSWNGFQLKPQSVGVSSIAVEGTELVVKGYINDSNIKCVKLHADGNGDVYGDDKSTTESEFEIHFDLTKIATPDKDYWFHIYVYGTENPTNLKDDTIASPNLPRDPFVAAGTSFEAGGLKFTVQGNNWNQIQIKVTQA